MSNLNAKNPNNKCALSAGGATCGNSINRSVPKPFWFGSGLVPEGRGAPAAVQPLGSSELKDLNQLIAGNQVIGDVMALR